jgi:hypothetical protein
MMIPFRSKFVIYFTEFLPNDFPRMVKMDNSQELAERGEPFVLRETKFFEESKGR